VLRTHFISCLYVFFSYLILQHDLLDSDCLKPITDEAVRNVAPLAQQCILAGCTAPSNEEYAPRAVEALHSIVWDRVLLAKVLLRDRDGKLHVILHEETSPDSINTQLVRDGLLRTAKRPNRRVKEMVCSDRVLYSYFTHVFFVL
jgi:hypothetical protein